MNLIPFLKDFLLVCIIFMPLERIFSLRPEQKILRRGLVTDLAHVGFTRILIALGKGLLFVLTLSFLKGLVPEAVHKSIAAQPLWLSFLEILVIADLGFYLVHRAFHAVPWLWRFHMVHHSIEEMDFIAAHRVHPIDQILTRSATLLPVFVLGFPPAAIFLFGVLYHWQSLLIHSNVRVNFGPLRWVLASPEFHHWHHANHKEAFDKNFAGQLPVLDLLFGTLYMPRGKRPEKYGISELVPDSYLGQLVHPFKRRPKQ